MAKQFGGEQGTLAADADDHDAGCFAHLLFSFRTDRIEGAERCTNAASHAERLIDRRALRLKADGGASE